MNTDLIFANISKHIHLTDKEKDDIHGRLQDKAFKKNEFILRSEEACNHIYFVNSGTLRAFFLNANGKESTIMFAIKDWWITDMYCFLNELPAMVNIQAVENSSVLRLSKKNMDELYEDIPSFNKLFRILMQNAYCREQLRMIENLSLPSIVRYNNFLNQYPKIASQVPLKQVASYLGITPEFLSTIRANKH
ncbi:MAG: Crp/Fnr family transcriptional regulator [Bacteroidota bacterium]